MREYSNSPSRKRDRARYRDDPAYRQQVLDRSRKHIAEYCKDPDYVRLMNLRKLIYKRREIIAKYLVKLEAWDRDLVAMVEEKNRLERVCADRRKRQH